MQLVELLKPRSVYGREVTPFLSDAGDSTYFVVEGHLKSRSELRWLLAAFSSTVRYYGLRTPFDPEDFLEYGYAKVSRVEAPGGTLLSVDIKSVQTEEYVPVTFMEI